MIEAGQRFGRLTALHDVGRRWRQACWACRCDCGAQTVAAVYALVRGLRVSCGCAQREASARGLAAAARHRDEQRAAFVEEALFLASLGLSGPEIVRRLDTTSLRLKENLARWRDRGWIDADVAEQLQVLT